MATLNYRFIALLLSGLLLSTPNIAEPFIPETSDTVIATWPVRDRAEALNPPSSSLDAAITVSEGLLARASQPGQSYLYSVAKATVAPWVKNDVENALLWVTWARILQNKHDFNGAKKSLAKALLLEPNNINAHLIMARIHLIHREYNSAEQSCQALIRSGDFISASVCKLEVQGHQGKLEQSYSGLKKIAESLPQSDPKQGWVGAVLADMAVRQGLWVESESLLDSHYDENELSVLIEWADVKLKLKKYDEVDKKLTSIDRRLPTSEDALLVRLAIAEIELNKAQLTSPPNTQWQKRVKERMELRELRQDLYHASDLTLFYLDIEPSAEKALYWAEVNWQQAQEYKDQRLLERARRISNNGPSKAQDQSDGGANDEQG